MKTVRMATRLPRLYQTSIRFASKKAGKKTIDKQSAALIELIESQKSKTVESFIKSNGAIETIDDAYAIQQNISNALESQTDKYQLSGYKIGGTASNIQSIWDVSEPFVSPFYNVWNFDNQTVEKPKGLTLGIESEFIFKIGETLNIDNKDSIELEDIYPLVDGIHPGFELIDLRLIDEESIFNIPIQYLIADLCWTGGIVIGPKSTLRSLGHRSWADYNEKELHDAAVELYINSDQKGIGYGREVFGSPFNALLFVYNHLLKRGKTVEEGQYVSTGTATGCNMLEVGDVAEGVFENIGDVEFTLT